MRNMQLLKRYRNAAISSAYRMIAAAIRAVQSGQRPENIVNGL